MKKLFLILMLLISTVSYAQIWEGNGGEWFSEEFLDGNSGSFDWGEYNGESVTIAFRNVGGDFNKSILLPSGMVARYIVSKLNIPAVDGYDFKGWSDLDSYPTLLQFPDTFTATATYYTVYTPRNYSVTFMVGDSAYHTILVPYGSVIPLPSDPDPFNGEPFYQWENLPESMPSHNIVVNAKFGNPVWGYEINQATGEVTYTDAAVGMNPVTVSTNGINNWSDDDPKSWKTFVDSIARPCMLNHSGSVEYYLDRDNQLLKEDGTNSDITSDAHELEAMVEFDKMYVKVSQPSENIIKVQIRKTPADGFNAYAFQRSKGDLCDKVYKAMFYGCNKSGKIRSLAVSGSLSLAVSNLEDIAKQHGDGWNIDYVSLTNYIYLLEVLVTKSINPILSCYGIDRFGSGTMTRGTVLVDKGAFSFNGNTGDKLFWIIGFHSGNYLERGLAYDYTSKTWLYKLTEPYSFSNTSDYESSSVEDVNFYSDTRGICWDILEKFTVADNYLLLPTKTLRMSSVNDSTPYGRSCLSSTTSMSNKIYNYISHGSHRILLGSASNFEGGFWNRLILHDPSWTNGVFGASLTYRPPN